MNREVWVSAILTTGTKNAATTILMIGLRQH